MSGFLPYPHIQQLIYHYIYHYNMEVENNCEHTHSWEQTGTKSLGFLVFAYSPPEGGTIQTIKDFWNLV